MDEKNTSSKDNRPSIGNILFDIRNARLTEKGGKKRIKGGPLMVLIMIVSRINLKAGHRHSFPSLELIAEDTALDVKSVKRALRTLEDADLLRREHRTWNSTVYHVNLPLIRKAAKARLVEADSAPIVSPWGYEDEDHETPAAESKPPAFVDTEDEHPWVDRAYLLVRNALGDHPLFQRHDAQRILTPKLHECFSHCQDGAHFILVLHNVLRCDALGVLPKVKDCKNLGGYLSASFAGWVRDLEANGRGYDPDVCLCPECDGLSDFVNVAREYWPGSSAYYEGLEGAIQNVCDLGHHMDRLLGHIFLYDPQAYIDIAHAPKLGEALVDRCGDYIIPEETEADSFTDDALETESVAELTV